MKNLLIILFACLLFIGCAKQETKVPSKVIEPTKPIIVKKPEEPVQSKPIIVEDDNLNKIAILYPSKIVGKYAKTTISTISAFLIYNGKKFTLQTFDTYDENEKNILEQLNLINKEGFTKVIAMVTQKGFNVLNSSEGAKVSNIYFPLIHKSEVTTENYNFTFGGISYDEQLNLLKSLSNGMNTMFYVESYRGNKLKNSYLQSFSNSGKIKKITRKQNNYKSLIKDNTMRGNTILLNTPIVKSSILLSQFTAFEINPYKVLSTQLNYNPLLIKLTQERDRKNFFIANSIAEVDNFIEEYTKILGADIKYNWVDFSSLVGANFLLNQNTSDKIETQIIDNQAHYEPKLYKSTSYGFEKVE